MLFFDFYLVQCIFIYADSLSLTHELYRSIVFNFPVFRDILLILLLLTFSMITLC